MVRFNQALAILAGAASSTSNAAEVTVQYGGVVEGSGLFSKVSSTCMMVLHIYLA